jgi:hypothetical protein
MSEGAGHLGLNDFPQQSEKLRELCACLASQKIPYYSSFNNWTRNSRYRYYIMCNQYAKPYNFPAFLNKPLSMAREQTTVFDEETRERVDVALPAEVLLRIKGPRVGSAIQAFIREGHVEVSDIRKVEVTSLVPDYQVLTLLCYLDPEEVRKDKQVKVLEQKPQIT